MKPLRVLRIADVPDNRSGGMSRAMYGTGDELAAAGHAVEYLFRDQLRSPGPEQLRRFRIPALLTRMVLARIRAGRHYDVVEIHEPIAAAYCLVRRFRPELPPAVLFSHGLEERAHAADLRARLQEGMPVSIKRRFSPLTVVKQAQWAVRHADHVLCCSREDVEYLRSHGVPDSRLTQHFNGVSEAFLAAGLDHPPPAPGSVLFLGSWLERKGIRTLIPAMSEVLRREPNVTLTVAGCGVPREVVARAFPEDVAERVKIVPRLEGDAALVEVYQGHSILVLPSIYEGYPLVMLEAAAVGLAIVTTGICGMADFVEEGITGLCIPVGDAPALREAVLRLVRDPDLTHRLGAAAHVLAASRTWKASAHGVATAYRAASSKRTDCETHIQTRGIVDAYSIGRNSYPSDDPLRILLVVHHDLDLDSGAAGSTLALAEAYRRRGHIVEVYSQDRLPRRLSLRMRNLLFPHYVRQQLRWMEQGGILPDVVDATTGDLWCVRRPGGGPLLVTRSTGLEHLVDQAFRDESARGGEPVSWRYPLYNGGWRLWEVARSLRRSDLVCFLNAVDRAFAVENLGIDPKRTVIVDNGIPEELVGIPLAPTASEPGIAVLGSAISRKGFRYTQAAVATLLARHPRLRVSMLGTGVESAEIAAGVEPHLRSRLTVIPHYQRSQLRELLCGHEVLLHPSLYEGYGKTLVEGMACGLAPISTAAGCAPSLLQDEVNALLVPYRDAPALVESAERLLGDAPLRDRLRRAAWATAQKHSWDAAAEHRLTAYRAALSRSIDVCGF